MRVRYFACLYPSCRSTLSRSGAPCATSRSRPFIE
ncbi:hypothetical protein RHECNPAF_14110055 [Rhizobium etli CNPAF512]|nr:hypothetical protein RHECNPAF_14110055 [Rhizobium etli CNPAF512]